MPASDPRLDGFPDFAWVVGEEGSDPIVSKGDADFRMDQYAASEHYDHMASDLASIAELGVTLVRYGMPWRLAEPERGNYQWSLWDTALDACQAAGLEPIIDLMHFGLPDYLPSLRDAAWVEAFADYVDAFLDRYPDLRWFTPINEPGVTARFSARFGMWNDRLASAEDHAVVLANVVLANLEALERVRSRSDRAWIASEALDTYVPLTAADEPAAAKRRAEAWLVWDLHLGHDPLPEAAGYLDPVADDVRSRIAELAITDGLIAGHDIYPVGIQPVGSDTPAWTIEDRLGHAAAELRAWHDRYRHPFWIAETSNLTLPVADQTLWLDTFVGVLRSLEAEGLPVRGLCWYSRGDQFDWQTALTNPVGAVTEVGLFDADRKARPVAARYAAYARGEA